METLDLPIDTCISIVIEYIDTLMYCISQGETDYTLAQYVAEIQGSSCASDPHPNDLYNPSEPYGSPEWLEDEHNCGRHRIV